MVQTKPNRTVTISMLDEETMMHFSRTVTQYQYDQYVKRIQEGMSQLESWRLIGKESETKSE